MKNIAFAYKFDSHLELQSKLWYKIKVKSLKNQTRIPWNVYDRLMEVNMVGVVRMQFA